MSCGRAAHTRRSTGTRPQDIYQPCGHDHHPDEYAVIEVPEVGLVCPDGFDYAVCRECHCDAEGEQTEASADGPLMWPCATAATWSGVGDE